MLFGWQRHCFLNICTKAEEEDTNEEKHKKKNHIDVECPWNYGCFGMYFKQFGIKVIWLRKVKTRMP